MVEENQKFDRKNALKEKNLLVEIPEGKTKSWKNQAKNQVTGDGFLSKISTGPKRDNNQNFSSFLRIC